MLLRAELIVVEQGKCLKNLKKFANFKSYKNLPKGPGANNISRADTQWQTSPC